MKDQALSPFAFRKEEPPIAAPGAPSLDSVEKAFRRLLELTSRQRRPQRTLFDWPRSRF